MLRHELKPLYPSKGRRRVGRGGKKGTYSGRGIKGQSARAGRKMVPMIRELIKRYPKLKGYRGLSLREYSAPVNLETIGQHFNDGDVVSPETLAQKGVIRATGGKAAEVKILGKGSIIGKKVIVERCKVSAAARRTIEKAGGMVK